jgi:hypothetical protein
MTTTATLTHAALRDAFSRQSLFQDKTWRLSPDPWPLTPGQLSEIEAIGQACLEFYRVLEQLYRRSHEGKNLLRNRQLTAPWVASYLDRGKPDKLIRHALHPINRQVVPSVIRPDLLITEDGFALTEMDSVPGGIGLTAYLNQLYAPSAGESLIGTGSSMIEAFYDAVRAAAPEIESPLIAIVVSDEAETYRPEFLWLAAQLRRQGRRVHCIHPTDIMPLGETLCAPVDGNPEKIDIIYRFFELFDLEQVATAPFILRAAEEGTVKVTPPMRHFQEEKLSLALLHHAVLEDFWRENLSRRTFKLLRKIIPRSWVMDPVDLPPNAVLDAPWVDGKPIREWTTLGAASQKERNLIIKASGFHENAWGARSVTLGSDSSREVWNAAIGDAIRQSDTTLHILQDYRKPVRLKHPVFREEDQSEPMEGRVRLCPYYFVQGDEARLGGILSTFCPADKKIIHGMKDAALLPCRVV